MNRDQLVELLERLTGISVSEASSHEAKEARAELADAINFIDGIKAKLVGARAALTGEYVTDGERAMALDLIDEILEDF